LPIKICQSDDATLKILNKAEFREMIYRRRKNSIEGETLEVRNHVGLFFYNKIIDSGWPKKKI